jgi:small conductance mechanosensitive channel
VKEFAPKLVVAILILVIGLILIKFVKSMITKSLKHSKMDVSLRHFLESLIGIILKVILVIVVISYLGFKSTFFVAILAAAGFAIGMAYKVHYLILLVVL